MLSDPEVLGRAVDELLQRDRRVRHFRPEIVDLQEELRVLVSEDAWKLYNMLATHFTQNADVTNRVVASWAFEEGRRARPNCSLLRRFRSTR